MIRERRAGPVRRPPYWFGEGTDQIAEIAVVGTSEYVFWLLFLNERAERLADLPPEAFDEPRLIRLADTTGVDYRRYLLDVDASAVPYLTSHEYFGARKPYVMPKVVSMTALPLWIRGRSPGAA